MEETSNSEQVNHSPANVLPNTARIISEN